MGNTQSPKINIHIVIPEEMFNKLRREGLINDDRIANVENVWFTETGLERMHVTVALDDSTPYTHVATAALWTRDEKITLDLKTSPM